MPQHDVVVIGGGPSGLYAARLLAEQGLDVVVLEKKSNFGDNAICTGIIGRETFAEFDLSAGSVTGNIQSVRMVSPSGQAIVYTHPTPFAAIVDRRSFDRDMARKALIAGVDIEMGVVARHLEIGADKVTILSEGQNKNPRRWTARLAVLATGNEKRLHEQAGLLPPRKSVFGTQAEVSVAAQVETSIYVGKSIAPGGFGWIVPAGPGRAKVGLLTNHDPRPAFGRFFNAISRAVGSAALPGQLGIKPIVQGMASRTVADRALALGEAAGQVKTTTGGGIYYGLLGARLAAETILRAYASGDFRAGALGEYERRWKSALRMEIAVGFWARKIYAWLSEAQVESLFGLAQTDGIIPLIQKEGKFDWQSGLIIDLIRKTSVFDFFKGLSRKPAFLERLLN